jgi:hypothetical protein
VGRRKQGATHAQQAQSEWELAQDWVNWLSAGNEPVPMTMHGLILEPGEVAYVTTPMHYSRLYGGSGEYMHSGGFAFGRPGFVLGMMAANAAVNSSRRKAARKDMQPMWRDLQELPTVVTNYRIMCHLPPRGWLSFYYTAVQEFYPEPANWMVTYGFSNAEPLRLGGLAAPTVAVLTAWCLLGADRWLENPGLTPLTEAARSRQIVSGDAPAELESGERRLPRIPGQD